MKKYELLLVLPGTLDENEAETRADEVLTLVKEHSSETEMVKMGKNRLAYPVKQIRYGYFYTIIFSAEADGLKILQDKLALMRDLLRAIISYFNVKYSPTTNLPYYKDVINNGPVVNDVANAVPVVEKAGDEPKAKTVKPALDLKDIDKKLDEILDESNLVAGV